MDVRVRFGLDKHFALGLALGLAVAGMCIGLVVFFARAIGGGV